MAVIIQKRSIDVKEKHLKFFHTVHLMVFIILRTPVKIIPKILRKRIRLVVI